MALARWHTYDEPLDMDGATYAVMAREMLAGKNLYTDVWDHKPPAVYVSYAIGQLIAGHGPAHIYLLGFSMAVVTLLWIYFVAVTAAGYGAGLWAATFWAIVSTDLLLQGNQPNTEAFMNACLIWALALLLRMPAESFATGRVLSIGALFALASLYKHVTLIGTAVLLGAYVVAAKGDRRSVARPAAIAGVIAASWAAVVGYFAVTGRFTAFVETVLLFNQAYGGDLWINITGGLRPDVLMPEFMLQFWPLLVPIAALPFVRDGRLGRRTAILFAGYVISTFLSIAIPGRYYTHYYQLWLPILCILAACGIALMRIGFPRLARILAVAVASVLALLQLQNFALSPQEWARRKFGPRLPMSQRAAELINQLLTPEQRFFQWGHHPELYYYSDRVPVGGEYRSRHLLNGPMQAERTARLLGELKAHRPELVVLVAGHEFPPQHPVPKWIAETYGELPPACDPDLAPRFTFIARRDGRLWAATRTEPCLRGDLMGPR